MRSNVKILIAIPRYTGADKINYRYPFPLGLGYISSALKHAGYSVDCLNINHHEGSINGIVGEWLTKSHYDYVLTGGNSLIYSVIEEIIAAVRRHSSSAKVIIGGPVVTSEPEVVFRGLKPDFAVLGEGEKTVVELLDCLERRGDVKEVKGIGYEGEGGEVRFTKSRELIKDLDAIPFPDCDGLGFGEKLDHAHSNDATLFCIEFDYPRTYSILGSRGCPYDCTFCYHHEKYRTRSLDSIMEEIYNAVRRYSINVFVIHDECFGLKKQYLYEFCDRMKRLKNETPWELKWMCQMAVNYEDKDKLIAMKEAGCYAIGYGFESFSPAVLKSMKKPITPEGIERAMRDTLDVGIAVMGMFIFGDVAETAETAAETLNYWKTECKGQLLLWFIQPYPGSEIYKHCVKKGIIKDKLEFIKNKIAPNLIVNMTENMTDREIKELEKNRTKTMVKYSKYVRPLTMKKTGENTYEFHVKCPYCQERGTYRNCFIENRFTFLVMTGCRSCHMHFATVGLLRKIAYANYWFYVLSRRLAGMSPIWMGKGHVSD